MLASAPKADIRLRRKIGRFRPQGDILQRDKDWSVRPPFDAAECWWDLYWPFGC